MKKIDAYIADDGSLHRSKKEAAIADLSTLLMKAGPRLTSLQAIVDHRTKVIAILQQIDSSDHFMPTHIPSQDDEPVPVATETPMERHQRFLQRDGFVDGQAVGIYYPPNEPEPAIRTGSQDALPDRLIGAGVRGDDLAPSDVTDFVGYVLDPHAPGD